MVHFKNNLKKVLVIVLVFISLNGALADKKDLEQCLMEMEKIFGVKTPPLDCIKIAIKDILCDDHKLGSDVRFYVINTLKYFATDKVGKKDPQAFCYQRGYDMTTPPGQSSVNTVGNFLSYERMQDILNITEECLNEIKCFGEPCDSIENAIRYHKKGIRPEEFANNSEYFFHLPGSHGEAYLDYIADFVVFNRNNVRNPFDYCHWINDELPPDENIE